MISPGRLCMKIAGRDAGKKCVVVEVLDQNFVLIDGNVRRKRCNISHLEPLKDVLEIKEGSHDEVIALFKKLKILGKEKVKHKPKKKKEPEVEKPARKKPSKKSTKPKK